RRAPPAVRESPVRRARTRLRSSWNRRGRPLIPARRPSPEGMRRPQTRPSLDIAREPPANPTTDLAQRKPPQRRRKRPCGSTAERLSESRRGYSLIDVDCDVTPLALPESKHAQRRAGEVAQHDRQPDVARMEAPHGLKQRAQSDGHRDLRHDRDVQGTTGIAGALQPARIGEPDGDEETRHAQIPEKLRTDR